MYLTTIRLVKIHLKSSNDSKVDGLGQILNYINNNNRVLNSQHYIL